MTREFTAWTRAPARSMQSLAADWDALVARVACDHPLLRSEFLLPLIEHYADDRTVVVSGRDATGRLRCAALVREESLGRRSTFCPAQVALCPIVAEDPSELVRGVFAGYWVAALSLLRVDPKYQSGLRYDRLPAHAAPYGTTMAIECSGSEFEAYWAARGKSLRKNIKRYYNRIERSFAGTRLSVVTATTDIVAAVQRYAAVESRGWKGREGTALALGSGQTAFYTDCLARFASAGGARVYELYLDDRLAASRLCVERGGILVILKTTYDEELAEFSPGKVLLYEMLEQCFADTGVRVVEFYTKADPDRLLWASETREIHDVTVYRGAFVRWAAGLARALKRRAPSAGAANAESPNEGGAEEPSAGETTRDPA